MKARFTRLLAAFPCAVMLAGAALAQSNEVDTLTTLVVQAVPMGEAMQMFIERDPTWPLKDKAGNVSEADLRCLRTRLGPTGFRNLRSEEVKAFAKKYPDRVGESVAVLEQGAAAFAGTTFMAGIRESADGKKADPKEVMNGFSPRQLSAYVELVGNEKHRPLRDMLGIGDAFSLAARAPEDRQRQEGMGRMLGMKLMLEAMDYCRVPLKSLQ